MDLTVKHAATAICKTHQRPFIIEKQGGTWIHVYCPLCEERWRTDQRKVMTTTLRGCVRSHLTVSAGPNFFNDARPRHADTAIAVFAQSVLRSVLLGE